jgi:hypothetical protein
VEVLPSLVLIPRTFGTIGTLEWERLEPTLVFNGLNGAQRLNDWNVLNKFFGNTVSDVPNVTRKKMAVRAWHRFS